MNCSEGNESQAGSWASGLSMDGLGQFEYEAHPVGTGQSPELKPAPGYIHGTPK